VKANKTKASSIAYGLRLEGVLMSWVMMSADLVS
jgi:hypothetical protein